MDANDERRGPPAGSQGQRQQFLQGHRPSSRLTLSHIERNDHGIRTVSTLHGGRVIHQQVYAPACPPHYTITNGVIVQQQVFAPAGAPSYHAAAPGPTVPRGTNPVVRNLSPWAPVQAPVQAPRRVQTGRGRQNRSNRTTDDETMAAARTLALLSAHDPNENPEAVAGASLLCSAQDTDEQEQDPEVIEAARILLAMSNDKHENDDATMTDRSVDR